MFNVPFFPKFVRLIGSCDGSQHMMNVIKVMNAKSMLEVPVSESHFSLKEYAGDVIIKKPLALLYLHKFFQ